VKGRKWAFATEMAVFQCVASGFPFCGMVMGCLKAPLAYAKTALANTTATGQLTKGAFPVAEGSGLNRVIADERSRSSDALFGNGG